MKRDCFHWPKYSLMVGVIVTSACSASARSGVHLRAAASSFSACAAKSRVKANSASASGSASPNATFPSPSRSGFTPGAWKSAFVPNSDVSVRKKKLPGCSSTLPPGSSTSNGTAFSGSEPSAPASMMTSNSASSGTPATTPSISS